MSIVKLAFSPAWLLHTPALFTMRSSASGKPLSFLSRQAKSNIATQRIQNLGLATLAHAEVRMRNGKIPDSTGLGAAFVDGKLFGNSLGGTFKALKKAKKGKLTGGFVKDRLKQYVDNGGKFNISTIKKDIKMGNNIYQDIKKISKKPLGQAGIIYGSGLGAIVSYDNDKGWKSTIPGALKGGIIGGAAGFGIKNAAKQIKNSGFKNIEIAHKEIMHKGNYWINRLKDANSFPYNQLGKSMAHGLTSNPGVRFTRMQRSQALSDLADLPINKSAWGEGKKKFKNLTHWTNESLKPRKHLDKTYAKQIRMADNRGDLF